MKCPDCLSKMILVGNCWYCSDPECGREVNVEHPCPECKSEMKYCTESLPHTSALDRFWSCPDCHHEEKVKL